ncbi:MAG: cupredoxin domain-containing protein [Gammaproteobacteria bacterium]|nr:cupredoxin domain-containing protein [Gammaproteobacteria bacterium]
MPRFRFVAVVLAAMTLVSAAGAADAPADPPEAATEVGAEAAIVSIEKYSFVPAELTVPVGTKVRWRNDEKRTSHSVWFQQDGIDESPRLMPGESFERTFTAPGRYEYRCGPHEEMHGTVIVVPR